MTEVLRTQIPDWAEGFLIAGELLAKRVYWNCPWLRSRNDFLRWYRKPEVQAASRDELKQYLRELGVAAGALVMAHTSVTDLQLSDQSAQTPAKGGFLATANNLINDLLELIGPTGTLVMPTHAHYQLEDAFKSDAQRRVPINYDPQTTPCSVGLANEMFRRKRGVLRSLHPYNSLAACGPLAEDLMRDNLNADKPLPHGVYSGYYRFSQMNGLVLSVGVPLQNSMTLIHCPEEVRDQDWPIKNFFEERQYLIRVNGKDELHVVRQRHPKYGKYYICGRKVFRDLAREGILHETTIGTVRVDWAHSREVFDYIMSRNRNSAYPYYGTRFTSTK